MGFEYSEHMHIVEIFKLQPFWQQYESLNEWKLKIEILHLLLNLEYISTLFLFEI